ncbi:MAG: glucokinase [Saprospiraceae bacterium]|nr:glucokinase [Saprospiraceae bacterium]
MIPLAFPIKEALRDDTRLLAADVGGTKTDVGLFKRYNGKMILEKEAVFSSKQFNSLSEIIRSFHSEAPLPERLSIAFAGPILDGKAKATNLDWQVDTAVLSHELGIRQVFLLNDLEAKAYGLAALTKKDFRSIYAKKNTAEGNIAIIAPGTGLGEAGLFWDGRMFHPFATEGGHTDFAPRNEFDWELLLYLQQQFGHVSWERVVSGPGIYQIYCFLRDVKHREAPEILQENIEKQDPAAAIALGAKENCPICEETMRLFVRYLAIETSNLALKLKATGGIFIGGGILPKIWNENYGEIFLEHFFEVGRMRPLLEEMPVQLILNPQTALLGAAWYGK